MTKRKWIEMGETRNSDGSTTYDIAEELNGGLLWVSEFASEADAALVVKLFNKHQKERK